jgi:two-component system sensor histidine kinase/response regulator
VYFVDSYFREVSQLAQGGIMATILVIEDAEDVRANLVDLLEAEEHQVFIGRNGKEGIQQARTHLPDLILCDVLMPELDGHGVLRDLRREPETATIPFIFLTARAETNEIRGGMSLGADDYLTKPFTRSDLLQSIATRLEKRAATIELFEGKMENLRHNMAHMLPHELRTPLTSIVGYSSLLLDCFDTLDPDEVRGMLSNIQSGAERLQRLIQKFLWYLDVELTSRDPARVAALCKGEIWNPSQALVRIAQDKATSMQRLNDLLLEIKEIPVRVGEEYLTYMLDEILENAFKFSTPGQSVLVNTRLVGNQNVLITITDLGRGMTPEQIRQVGAYLQFDRNKYEQQGQGMGLAIVRRIAEIYGGHLTIESEPNQHTQVIITLPIPSADLEADHL